MNWYKKHVYGGLPAYTLEEFLYKLKVFGVEYHRPGNGDYAIFINTNNNKQVAIPMGPGSRTINPLTMKEMLGYFGIPWDIWKNLPKSPKKRDFERVKDQLPWSVQETPEPSQTEIPEWQKQKWYLTQQQYAPEN
jgi:hypothetical protein